MIYKVEKGKRNYSQRNNELLPHASCNTTSIVMALDYIGYTLPKGEYRQPEDNLTAFMDSPLMLEYRNDWAKSMGVLWPLQYRPAELLHCLEIGTNEWLGKQAVTYNDSIDSHNIFFEIMQGRPVVLSTAFTSYGHIVTLVGIETPQKNIYEPDEIRLDTITKIFIDDPWGNVTKDYKAGIGNDVEITMPFFFSKVKHINSLNKRAFTFKGLE
jgi:hypothetical protein